MLKCRMCGTTDALAFEYEATNLCVACAEVEDEVHQDADDELSQEILDEDVRDDPREEERYPAECRREKKAFE